MHEWASPDTVKTNVVALTIALAIEQSLIKAWHSNPSQRKRCTRHRPERTKRKLRIHPHTIAISDCRRRDHGVPLVRCRKPKPVGKLPHCRFFRDDQRFRKHMVKPRRLDAKPQAHVFSAVFQWGKSRGRR